MKLPKSVMKLKTEAACLRAIDKCHERSKALGVEAEKKDKEWRDLAKRLDGTRPGIDATEKDYAAHAAGKELCDTIQKTANRLFKLSTGQLKKSKKISLRLAELRTIPISEVERALTT